MAFRKTQASNSFYLILVKDRTFLDGVGNNIRFAIFIPLVQKGLTPG